MPRKIDGAAVAEKFGDGYRLKLKARTGEEIHFDLSGEAASQLAGQLKPERAAASAPQELAGRARAPKGKRD
jgi:hypothetical protein